MIQADVAALFEGPNSLIAGTVDTSGQPEATRIWGVEVLGADRVRILVPEAARETVRNLAHGGAIAITATEILTNRSIQLKGRAGEPLALTDADHARNAAYVDGFFRIIDEADTAPAEILERMRPRRFVAFEVVVEASFDQTPGPAAGRALPERERSA